MGREGPNKKSAPGERSSSKGALAGAYSSSGFKDSRMIWYSS
jgi:hypothetical protein